MMSEYLSMLNKPVILHLKDGTDRAAVIIAYTPEHDSDDGIAYIDTIPYAGAMIGSTINVPDIQSVTAL